MLPAALTGSLRSLIVTARSATGVTAVVAVLELSDASRSTLPDPAVRRDAVARRPVGRSNPAGRLRGRWPQSTLRCESGAPGAETARYREARRSGRTGASEAARTDAMSDVREHPGDANERDGFEHERTGFEPQPTG